MSPGDHEVTFINKIRAREENVRHANLHLWPRPQHAYVCVGRAFALLCSSSEAMNLMSVKTHILVSMLPALCGIQGGTP